jgi:dUTP pyrophosphatase
MFPFTKIRDVKSPERGTTKSAGVDFYAPNDIEEITLQPGESALIPTGLRFIIPEGLAFWGANRSGMASKDGVILGAELIDEDYRGEPKINLWNVSTTPTTIKPGQKIAQFVLVHVSYELPTEVDGNVYEMMDTMVPSERGSGGFGHTDKKVS